MDVFAAAGGMIATVGGYFDRQTLAEQLGLQVIVQPHAAGPFEFGYSIRAAGRKDKPGAVSLTWIQARSPEEADQVRGIARPLAAELIKAPGCISWLAGGIGHHLYTITAWDSVDAVQQVWKSSLHNSAVKRFFHEDFAAAVGTSVFTVDHVNAVWMRCADCGQVINRTEHDTCPCGQPLPEPTCW